ncbi:DeoR family transcriptional regulator [Candidatus Nomurabacteria bacterium]|nr:DeoR family transcriptional regulator [Candidatus Nomurabacteria bacterium]
MPDKSRKFHEFTLRSILFRGRNDWFFCYLKSERIAHVLSVLALSTPEGRLDLLADTAGRLPTDICRLAAGELDAAAILADVMGLLSSIRLSATKGFIHKEHAVILCAEYEYLAEKLVQGSHPSPFGSEEFSVPHFGLLEAPSKLIPTQKDVSDIKDKQKNKGQSGRAAAILDVLKKQKTASIKALAAVITDCSEKTIQRELGYLIEQGLVRKNGERRWSVYSLVEGS